MISIRPKQTQLTLSFAGNLAGADDATRAAQEPQGGQSYAAVMEKPALDSISKNLMEQVVDSENMEQAWRNVKANRGAPGPDGITLTQFPEYIRALWPKLRQQLLDGTYWPQAARRKAIAKPDGGERLLGIPNITDRLIQHKPSCKFSRRSSIRVSPSRVLVFDQDVPHTEPSSKPNALSNKAAAFALTWTFPNFSIESNTTF